MGRTLLAHGAGASEREVRTGKGVPGGHQSGSGTLLSSVSRLSAPSQHGTEVRHGESLESLLRTNGLPRIETARAERVGYPKRQVFPITHQPVLLVPRRVLHVFHVHRSISTEPLADTNVALSSIPPVSRQRHLDAKHTSTRRNWHSTRRCCLDYTPWTRLAERMQTCTYAAFP